MYNLNDDNIAYIKRITKQSEDVWIYGVNVYLIYYHSLIDNSVSLIRHFGCATSDDNSGNLLCNTITKFKLTELQNHENDSAGLTNIGFCGDSYEWFAITDDTIKVFSCKWQQDLKEIKLQEAKDYLKELGFNKKWIDVYETKHYS